MKSNMPNEISPIGKRLFVGIALLTNQLLACDSQSVDKTPSSTGSASKTTTVSAPASPNSASAIRLIERKLASDESVKGVTVGKARAVLRKLGYQRATAFRGGNGWGLSPSRDVGKDYEISHIVLTGAEADDQWLMRSVKSMARVQEDKHVLGVRVGKKDKPDVSASMELLRKLLQRGKDPTPHYEKITPPKFTWLKPRTAKVGAKLKIEPLLVEQIVRALKREGYKEASEGLSQSVDTANPNDGGRPMVRIISGDGKSTEVFVACSREGKKPERLAGINEGGAGFQTGQCVVFVYVRPDGETSDRAKARQLLQRMMRSPP